MVPLFQRILKLSGKYRGRIETAFLFSVLKAILSKMPLCVAFLMLSRFYTGAITAADCVTAAAVLCVSVLLEAFFQLMSDRLQSGAGYMMFAEQRMALGAHLRKLPMGYFTAGNIGKISSVLTTDMIFVEEIAMSSIANMMSYAFSAALMAVFLFYLDVRLGIIGLLVTVTAMVTAGKMNRISMKEAAGRQEQSEKLTDAVLSFTEGIAIIKSYNLLGEKSAELSNNFKWSRDKSLGFEEAMTPWQRGLNLIYACGMALLFGVSIYLQQTGSLTIPYLMGLLLFVFDLFGPLKALYGEAARLTVMNSCLDRIESVCAEKELPDEGKKHIPERNHKAEIAFDHVTFAYHEKEVLKDVTFQIQPNTMTALVGPSGGGKSTAANLLARFWDVKSGCIRMRGEDIRDVPLAELMDHISVVFQRVYLFQDTIYQNISMGKTDASKEEVYELSLIHI